MSGFVLEINLSECLSAAVTIPRMDHPACPWRAPWLPSSRAGLLLDRDFRLPRTRACTGWHDGRMDLPAQRDTARQGRQGEFTVHDLENIGDHEMVFVTVEFKDSANMAMAL